MLMAYDRLDRITRIKDQPGNTWTYVFDSLSRRLSANDPDHGLWTFAYDAAGELVKQTDANGAVSNFQYDGRDRMVGRQHLTSAGVQTQWHVLTYDQDQGATFSWADKLTSTSGHWGSTTHKHDLNGHKVIDDWTLGGTTYTVQHARDAGGFHIWSWYSDGDQIGSATTPWQYDDAGRLKSIPGHISGLTYNARGQVTVAAYANGVSTNNLYNDQRGWLSRVVTQAGATTLQDITYSRAATGRIASVSAVRAEDNWSYTYDHLDRLLSATNSGDASLSQTFTAACPGPDPGTPRTTR